MKTQMEKLSNLERKLNVEVPAHLVTTTFNRFFENVQKNVELKGFRKGKAPLTMIKTLYSDRVKNDVLQELLKMGYSSGLQEHQLNPVSYPEFEFDDLTDGNNFSFSAQFEIIPEVELQLYEGLELERTVFKVEPQEADTILENIRKSRSTQEEVTESRPAEIGDIAEIDFKGFVDGQPLERGDGTNHPLELGSKSFITGFEEGIVGMRVGESKTLNLKFPENYHADLSNKDVTFEISLKKLSKKVFPELNDEFIRTITGGTGTLEDLKKNILDDLEERQKQKTEETLKELLLKKLITLNPVEVPKFLIAEQKNLLIEDTKKKMAQENMGEKEFEEYRTKWDQDFENSAKEMIQAAYIINAIASKHSLNASQSDVDLKFEEYAKQTGIDIARIKEHYQKEDSMNRLAHKITEDKVVEYLLSKANIKDITAKPKD